MEQIETLPLQAAAELAAKANLFWSREANAGSKIVADNEP
jgi:hypothetical protein